MKEWGEDLMNQSERNRAREEQTIFDLLTEIGPLTRRQLRRHMAPMSHAKVQDIVNRLITAGLVITITPSDGDITFSIADKNGRIKQIQGRIMQLETELVDIINPTEQEWNDAAEFYMDNRKEAVEVLIDDRARLALDILGMREIEAEADKPTVCGNCPNPIGGDETVGKTLGCHGCELEFCSAECLVKHEEKAEHIKSTERRVKSNGAT